MIIESPKARYEVGKLVAETELYRLYLCMQEDSDQQYLFQVANEQVNNGKLDKAAFILGKLQSSAIAVEEEYAKIKDKPNRYLNYQLGFPAVEESFKLTTQGNRRVNILKFNGVESIRDLVPLSTLVNKDRLRVDIRTSIWIMGKALKTLSFAHDSGLVINNLSLGNILIEPDQHYVIFFNWADAQLTRDRVTRSEAREEIIELAHTVIKILDGSVEDGIPNDGSEGEVAYCKHLIELATNGHSNAFNAHKEFYELVDSIWERGFHEFTALPRGR